jgi:hypothetical protein
MCQHQSYATHPYMEMVYKKGVSSGVCQSSPFLDNLHFEHFVNRDDGRAAELRFDRTTPEGLEVRCEMQERHAAAQIRRPRPAMDGRVVDDVGNAEVGRAVALAAQHKLHVGESSGNLHDDVAPLERDETHVGNHVGNNISEK